MSSDVDEIKDSVKEAITQRIKSPALGAFACAWILSNWQFLMILCFSAKPVEERIPFLLKEHADRSHMLYIPLCAAAAFVLLGPWLEFLVMIIRGMPDVLIARWKEQQAMRIAEFSYRRSRYRVMEEDLLRRVRIPSPLEEKKPNKAPATVFKKQG